MTDDGISLISAEHPTKWRWKIKYFFIRPNIKKCNLITFEVDTEKYYNKSGLKILKRRS